MASAHFLEHLTLPNCQSQQKDYSLNGGWRAAFCTQTITAHGICKITEQILLWLLGDVSLEQHTSTSSYVIWHLLWMLASWKQKDRGKKKKVQHTTEVILSVRIHPLAVSDCSVTVLLLNHSSSGYSSPLHFEELHKMSQHFLLIIAVPSRKLEFATFGFSTNTQLLWTAFAKICRQLGKIITKAFFFFFFQNIGNTHWKLIWRENL